MHEIRFFHEYLRIAGARAKEEVCGEIARALRKPTPQVTAYFGRLLALLKAYFPFDEAKVEDKWMYESMVIYYETKLAGKKGQKVRVDHCR